MNSQKVEDLLNLSLSSTQQEREKSRILNVGYDDEEKTWEIIVKYHGDIKRLEDEVIRVEILLNGYAIITVPESLLDALTEVEEIEYIEKPKSLIYNIYDAKIASCILPLEQGSNRLSGNGVLIAIIDSGIDYTLPDFQDVNGSRILYYWDQTLLPDETKGWTSPNGFYTGVEFTKDMLDEALSSGERIPSIDASGHGTAVAGIAAGSASNALYRGVAPQSDLLVVKLGIPMEQGFPRTTELMRAIAYVLNKATELARPLAINLSFGNTYGAHDGTSLVERFLDNASEVGRTVICVGSGNEASSGGHASSRLLNTSQNIELAFGSYETSLSVALWKNYADRFEVMLIAPDGERYMVNNEQAGRQTFQTSRETILIYFGRPTPYSVNQEIFFDFIPNENYLSSGIWTFVLSPVYIVNGIYHLYLPSEVVRGNDTRFLTPNPELTLTIPSTASKVLSVGAYQQAYRAYADFSGRGYEFNRNNLSVANPPIKPELIAPGVNLLAPSVRGGYERVTGTSFATPIVTGAAALLMEWGMIKGNDPYLYGEKVKAYFIRGAKQLPSMETPNPMTGWGALCVEDSLIR